jgi:hypothetical protein
LRVRLFAIMPFLNQACLATQVNEALLAGLMNLQTNATTFCALASRSSGSLRRGAYRSSRRLKS